MTDKTDLNEQEKIILDLWEKGFTGQQIGEQLGKTRSSVLGKLNRLRKRGFVDYKAQANRLDKQKEDVKHIPANTNIKRSIAAKRSSVPFIFKTNGKDKYPPTFIKPTRLNNGDPVTLMELETGMCKYSVSEDMALQHMFCGRPIYKRAYCADHHKLCYVEPYIRQRQKS
jgi:hypothetical protein